MYILQSEPTAWIDSYYFVLIWILSCDEGRLSKAFYDDWKEQICPIFVFTKACLFLQWQSDSQHPPSWVWRGHKLYKNIEKCVSTYFDILYFWYAVICYYLTERLQTPANRLFLLQASLL